MKLNWGFVKVSIIIAALAGGFLAARLRAPALETEPGIRVDSTPIARDPQTGNSYAPVVKKVAPSVVNIYSSRIVKERYYRNPLMADPLFRQFFGGANSIQEIAHRDEWLGCGTIVTPDGYILTANHVVEGADEIKVRLQNDKTEYSAKVIGLDPPTDVAVLKVDARNLPAVTLGDSDQLEVGDVVLAIGNPFGVGQTVTRGIISALGRSLGDPNGRSLANQQGQYQDFIQTDAAINEGNSGGALIDAQGRLIGVNDAIVSPSGASAGIGFAVPVNLSRSVMLGFINHGRVARGNLVGVQLQDIDAGLAKGYGAPDTEGALVTDVAPGSPAAKAGLVADDVVVAVNDKKISGADNLRVIVAQLPPGSAAKLKLFRNGAPKTITVTLAEAAGGSQGAPKPDDSAAQPAKADALDGVQVLDLNLHIRRQLMRLGAPQTIAGALVTDVDRASNSYAGGLRPDDVIQAINRQPVASADEAVRLCRAARTENMLVKVWRPDRGGGRVLVLDINNTKRAN